MIVSNDASHVSHALALGACLLLTATSQLLLKHGASGETTARSALLNRFTLSGYALLVMVTVLAVYAMQAIELKVVTAWTALTYLMVTAGSATILGEHVNRARWLGSALIVAGIAVFQW